MELKLGQLEVDVPTVAKQLKQDFRDDWFPDPVGFDDVFESSLLSEVVNRNIGKNHGAYIPAKAQLLNVPKSNFTLRYALETSVTDRAIYHSLARSLLPYFDPLIEWQVFSHRRAQIAPDDGRSGSKYLFRNGITAWADFLGCVEEKIAKDTVLLSTDLANYFENIQISLLKSKFIAYLPEVKAEASTKTALRDQINQLFDYLGSWSFQSDRGLPQNRDASSFLANVYMRDVDVRMLHAGFKYFRYMDDIKIVCPDQAGARRALKELVLALRPLGQFVNSGKTRIVASTDVTGVRECLDTPSIEMRRIATAWNSKSLKPISRTFIPLRNMLLGILSKRDFNTREFRFCISRMETLARCSEFSVPSAYFTEITEGVIDGLGFAPVASDQMTRYLRCVPLANADFQRIRDHVLLDDNLIYNWKNYRVWLLLTQLRHVHPDLLKKALYCVQHRDDDPTRAGATIYLGALGSKTDREEIARRFKGLTSFLGQRNALLAVQQLHFKAKKGGVGINTDVAPYLRDDLGGTYRNLNRAGRYTADLEPISITRFVDLERDYA